MGSDTETLRRNVGSETDPAEGTWDHAETRRRNLGSETETTLEGTWDQTVTSYRVISYRDPPVDRQTPVKTLPCPQTSFAGGKNPFFDSVSLQTNGICFQRTEQWQKLVERIAPAAVFPSVPIWFLICRLSNLWLDYRFGSAEILAESLPTCSLNEF